MRFREHSIAIGILIALFSLCVASAETTAQTQEAKNRITLLAEEIPGGFLKIEGTRGVGVYPDLLYEAATASETEIVFRFVPWGRAFQEVERSTHFLTFPLTRLPEREARYTWLVSLDKDEIVFLTRNKPVNTLEQARKLKRILVWQGSSMEIFLTEKGFTNLISAGKTTSLVKMLARGRGDAWFTVRPEHDEVVDVDGHQVKFVAGDIIHTESVWLVGGKSFAHSEASRRFSNTVRNLVVRGRLKALKSKYGLLKK